MITNNDLYAKYGNEIVFLFKGSEPYVEKYGAAAGVLIEKNNKILCNECGGWFERLATHTSMVHGMKSDQYKEKYGFNKSAPLCTKEQSEKASLKTILAMEKRPELKKIAILALNQGHKTMKERINPLIGIENRLQKANTRDSCPEQIKRRYNLLRAKFGDDVGINTIKIYDSGIITWAQRHYDSWNNFKKTLGFEIVIHEKEAADLIYDLRKYVSENGRLPWGTRRDNIHQTLDGFAHSLKPYLTKWGSRNRAFLACGISRGNGRRTTIYNGDPKQWILVDYE